MRSKRYVGAALVAAALTAAVVVAPAAGAQPGTGRGLPQEVFICPVVGEVTVSTTRGNVAFSEEGIVFHLLSITFPGGSKTFGQMKGLGVPITCTSPDLQVTVTVASSPA